LLRLQQPVGSLSDLAHELAATIELEEARSTMSNSARRANRDGRVACPRIHVDIAARVGRDAGDFSELPIIRRGDGIGIRIELQRWNGLLGRESAGGERQRG
jgi:hypothetical protein